MRVLGVVTGWLWEDLGGAGVKGGARRVEGLIEEWNGRRRGEGEGGLVMVVPLRRTGYLCLDIQIPDPQVGVVGDEDAEGEGTGDESAAGGGGEGETKG